MVGGVCGRGMHGGGHAWQGGMCGGGHVWQEKWQLQRVVCILLECILVTNVIVTFALYKESSDQFMHIGHIYE